MKFNRDIFFTEYKRHFGRFSDKQQKALDDLLSFVEEDDAWQVVKQFAYALATIRTETGGADVYSPVRESGRGRGKAYGRPDKITGQTYYGRGYVQLTWLANYRQFEGVGGAPLVSAPDQAMIPVVAWKILSLGMQQGLFRKTSGGQPYAIGNFIPSDEEDADYYNARNVINGIVRKVANTIAADARAFEAILFAALIDESAPATITEENGKDDKIALPDGSADQPVVAIPDTPATPPPTPMQSTLQVATARGKALWETITTTFGVGAASVFGIFQAESIQIHFGCCCRCSTGVYSVPTAKATYGAG